jgi:hypothetical protein
LIIGKSKNPRCFNHLKNVPLPYEANKNAWMTQQVFDKWILDLDETMKKKKIILFMDNATCHGSAASLKLSNIKIEYLPTNTTSLIQPMDAGVIKNFKCHYRRKILQKILSSLEEDEALSAKDMAKSVSLLDAIHMLKSAWDEVKSTTVVNCFKQCKFPATADEPAEEEPERSETLQASDEDPPFGMTQKEFLLYVECNENVDVCGEFSDAELLQMVRQDQDKSDEEDENHPEDDKETEAPPSNSEALKLLHRLRLYIDSTGVSALDEIYQLESKVQRHVLAAKMKQKKITHFF